MTLRGRAVLLCALWGEECDADLSTVGNWSDGTPVYPALVSAHPRDMGPYPVVLAECDEGFGPTLNPRIERCGPTYVPEPSRAAQLIAAMFGLFGVACLARARRNP